MSKMCGCNVQGVDLKRDKATIVYCPIHKAAPKLMEALVEIVRSADSLDTGDEGQMALEVSKRLIEKARKLIGPQQ